MSKSLTHVFSLSTTLLPVGPGARALLPSGGAQTPAVAGDQSQGALWLRVEGPDDERICGRQGVPYAGVCD